MAIKPKKLPLTGKPVPLPVPAKLAKGDYLICYDIRENRRLQRIQRLTAKLTVYLQRSVYLYRGQGQALLDLFTMLRAEMEEGDDLRIYNMSHVRDMWFLSYEKSVVQEVGQPQGIAPTWWQRLLGLVWRWK